MTNAFNMMRCFNREVLLYITFVVENTMLSLENKIPRNVNLLSKMKINSFSFVLN